MRFLFLLFTFGICVNAGATPPTITIHYSERSPYSFTKADGTPTGFMVEPVTKALRKAKIPFIWLKTPINRQFMILKENTKPTDQLHCTVGGLKTPDRESYATFTVPYYKTKGLVVVTGMKIAKKKYPTFESFMKTFTILLKDNYSYGPVVDQLLTTLGPSKVMVAGESEQMLEMISKEHGDYMVISAEILEDYFKREPTMKSKLNVVHFKEISEKLNRYMMCRKSVSEKIMAKINKRLLK